MTPELGRGIVSVTSHHSVDATVERLQALLQAKGIRLFILIDHSGEAEKVGQRLRPTKLLIFGNPAAGTPLMAASPSIALDLPLKLLVSEDETGTVRVSYNAPEYLQHRHDLPPELAATLAGAAALATAAGD